jgi:hypothetical protein
MSELEDSIECSICFYPILSEKYVTECKHTFHHNCLREWTLQRPVCPLCNSNIDLPAFNDVNFGDMQTGSETELRTLANDLDYQRYIETIRRQSLVDANNNYNNISNNALPYVGDATVIIVNDYDMFIENTQFNIYSTKNRVLIVIEFISTCSVISNSINPLHTIIAAIGGITTGCWRVRFLPNRALPLIVKIVYILYYAYVFSNPNILYVFIPWFLVTLF